MGVKLSIYSRQAFIYGRNNCSDCEEAKLLLDLKRIPWEFWNIETDDQKFLAFRLQFPDAKTVPQIIINGQKIGSVKKLKEYFANERI